MESMFAILSVEVKVAVYENKKWRLTFKLSSRDLSLSYTYSPLLSFFCVCVSWFLARNAFLHGWVECGLLIGEIG